MKTKILLITVFSFLSFSAFAGDFYAGLDLVRSKAKHEYVCMIREDGTCADGAYDNAKIDNVNYGGGVYLGYRTHFDTVAGKMFIAPEIYYDYLRNSSRDMFSLSDPVSRVDKLKLNSRYGGKINLGYYVLDNVAVFVNYGVSYIDFDVQHRSINQSYGKSKLDDIYGFGVNFNVTDSLGVRLSYDRQSFNIQYVREGLRDRVTLNAYKVGAFYNF